MERATASLQQGNLDDAKSNYQRILKKNPLHAEALHHLGIIAFMQKNYEKAEELMKKSIQVSPSRALYLSNLGAVLKDQEKLVEAEAYLHKALAIKPDYFDALLNLSSVLVGLKKTSEAIVYCQKLLEMKPDCVEVLCNLAAACRMQEDSVSAIKLYQRAIAADPACLVGYTELSILFGTLKMFDLASVNCLKAINLEPTNLEHFFRLALACRELGNLQASLQFLRHAEGMAPDNFNIKFSIGHVLLALGDMPQGWAYFEARWYKETEPVSMVTSAFPWWNGESLKNKIIMVWGEQGVGDQMMFASMYEELIAMARQCVFVCTKKLIPLFQRSFPQALVINSTSELVILDSNEYVQSAAGSLGRFLRPDVASFPKKDHFLVPNPERVLYWKQRLAECGPELKIGISWRSGNLMGDRGFYAASIEQLQPIFSVPGVRFVTLQYDDCSAELAKVKNLFSVDIVQFPEVDLFDDLDESAALMKSLDLVISVGNASAILAAALGVPTWMMVTGFEWQKFGTSENCWYATLRSFEKPWDQDWESYIEQIAQQLKLTLTERQTAAVLHATPGEGLAPLLSLPARNDPCFCGSGKKYKHCCMAKRALASKQAQSERNNIAALIETAKQHHQRGQLLQAQERYQSILQIQPDHADALHFLGVIRYQTGQLDEAEALFRRAIHANPAVALYYCNLGFLLRDKKQYGQAEESLKKAIALQPDYADAYFKLGATQIDLGKYQDGANSSRKAIALQPDHVPAIHNLGTAQRLMDDFDSSIKSCQRAIALEPGYAAAYANLAANYIATKKMALAASACCKALALDDKNADAHMYLGLVFQEQGDLENSVKSYKKAALLAPDNSNTVFNLSLVLLASGDFEDGWKGYAARWTREINPVLGQYFPYPHWQGEVLDNKTILIWGEQGIGDQIMFASMYSELISSAQLCVFACAKKLLPLFSHSFPLARVVSVDDANALGELHDRIDVQASAGALGRWLRPNLASFRFRDGFLLPHADRVSYWKSRLADLGPALNVGISWRSANMKGDRPFYCTRIDQWGPILQVPGVRFINLQYDECTVELEQARALFDVCVHGFAEVDLFNDLAEAAALSQALDLVISAPNAAAILAAAVGVPSWMMTSGFDWQHMGELDNCWCSKAKTFHKSWEQDWDGVVDDIAAALREKVGQ